VNGDDITSAVVLVWCGSALLIVGVMLVLVAIERIERWWPWSFTWADVRAFVRAFFRGPDRGA